MTRLWILLICGMGLLMACSKEQPSHTVTEFLDDPILLEAAMVRCAQDRAGMRYEADCINARAAVSRIQVKEEAASQADLDASFERKRRALRRKQEQVAESERRAVETERLRKEAEYLAQFGGVPQPSDLPTTAEDIDVDDVADAGGTVGNAPIAVISESDLDAVLPENFGNLETALDGGNAPLATSEPEPDPEPGD
jgi:hypothetical protein